MAGTAGAAYCRKREAVGVVAKIAVSSGKSWRILFRARTVVCLAKCIMWPWAVNIAACKGFSQGVGLGHDIMPSL